MTDSLLTSQLTLPDDFSARPAQRSDNDALVDLYNEISMRIRNIKETEPDHFHKVFAEPDFEIETSTCIVENSSGEIVGYAAVWDNNNLPILTYCSLVIHPDYENIGIGDYLLDWIDSLAPRVVEKCPANARVVLRIGTEDLHKHKIALVERNGYQVVRHWWEMFIERPDDIPEPQFPEGITITTFNPDDEAQFHALIRAEQDGFRDHWGFVEHEWDDMVKWWSHWIETITDFDPSIWFLAVDDASDEIAGIALNAPTHRNNPNYGYLDSLTVRRPWRRRGLALALLHHSFKELWARGKSRVSLDVDASSLTGATRLYEKAGMQIYRKGMSYEKVLREGEDLSTTEVE